MGTVGLRYFCPIPFKFLGHFVKLESMIICIYKLETVKSCPLAGLLISIGISMLVVKLRMRLKLSIIVKHFHVFQTFLYSFKYHN